MSIDSPPRTSPPRPARRIALPRWQLPVSAGPKAAAEEPPATPEPPRLPARRNPKWIALGVIAICLGGLLSFVIYARVATETTVVAMAATVYRGEPIEAADLTSVTLQGDPSVPTIPTADAAGLIGQRAAYDLVEGTLAAPSAVASEALPAAERAVIGMRLAGGRAPADFLQPGAPIRLVALPPAAAQPGAKDQHAGKTYLARTVSVKPGPDAGSLLVDVDVAAGQAAVIATLAAQERLAIVRDAGR